MGNRSWQVYEVLLLALMMILPLRFAYAQDSKPPPIDKPALARTMTVIDGNEKLQKYYKACPAELFNTGNTTNYVSVDNDDVPNPCRKKPEMCLNNCLEKGDAKQCLELAQVFQDDGLKAKPVYSQTLFAMACVRGEPSGCTNRGAGLTIGDYGDDPWKKVTENKRLACGFRSFKVSCENNDAWGCFMHGDTYKSGLGTARSPLKAKAAFQKTCKIDPNFEACDYAKNAMEGFNN